MSRQDVYPCPSERHGVLDVVADIGHNAVDAGLDGATVSSALREAADEIEAESRGVES